MASPVALVKVDAAEFGAGSPNFIRLTTKLAQDRRSRFVRCCFYRISNDGPTVRSTPAEAARNRRRCRPRHQTPPPLYFTDTLPFRRSGPTFALGPAAAVQVFLCTAGEERDNCRSCASDGRLSMTAP